MSEQALLRERLQMILTALDGFRVALRRSTRHPQVTWRGAIGLRDVLAHGYFQVNPEQLYAICEENIPPLIETIRLMIQERGEDDE